MLYRRGTQSPAELVARTASRRLSSPFALPPQVRVTHTLTTSKIHTHARSTDDGAAMTTDSSRGRPFVVLPVATFSCFIEKGKSGVISCELRGKLAPVFHLHAYSAKCGLVGGEFPAPVGRLCDCEEQSNTWRTA